MKRAGMLVGVVLAAACGRAPGSAPGHPQPSPRPASVPTSQPGPVSPSPAAGTGESLAGQAAGPGAPVELAAYQDHLRRYDSATYAKLAAELGIRPRKDEPLSFDPTSARYFDQIAGQLKLTPAERAVYARHGMVSVDHEQRYSMGSAYFAIYARDLPVLVTTDSILHALHRSYDAMLKSLEQAVVLPVLADTLLRAHDALEKHRAEFSSGPLAESASDVDVYLAVARALMAGLGVPPAPPSRDPVYDQELREMRSEAERSTRSRFANDAKVKEVLDGVASLAPGHPKRPTELNGGRRPIDYSQFRPRGHYTESRELERYFRTMLWLGRADTAFVLAPPDPRSSLEVNPEREARSAALLTLVLAESGGVKALGQLRELVDFMVGRADNVRLEDMQGALGRALVTRPRDLADAAVIRKLQAEFAALGPQKIRSQVVTSPIHDSKPVPPPQTFQVFGQRFVLDSFVLANVVFDSIVFQGVKQRRMMPSGLDVMAALGNDEAVALLRPALEKHNYGANLLALRKTIDPLSPEVWGKDLYGLWLDGLRALDDQPQGKHVPSVMRREPWRRKQLQTQLASWAELRHDTLLYAKQSYTGYPLCGYPAGFVEPYPEFYRRMERLARAGATRLGGAGAAFAESAVAKRTKGLREQQVAFLERFAEIMELLTRLAEKELAAQPFTPEEELFLQKTIDRRGGGSGPPRYDGWYPKLIYGGEPAAWKPTVADVHTDPESAQVLEAGVGDVEFLVLAVDNESERTAFVGPVYSYYEFVAPAAARLTNEAWQQRITAGNTPPPLEYTKAFRAKPAVRELGPVVDERRIEEPRAKRMRELRKQVKSASQAQQNKLYREIRELERELGDDPIPAAGTPAK